MSGSSSGIRTLRLVASHGQNSRQHLIPTAIAGTSQLTGPSAARWLAPSAADDSNEISISLLRQEYREWRWANALHARHALRSSSGPLVLPPPHAQLASFLDALLPERPNDTPPKCRGGVGRARLRDAFRDFHGLGRGGFGVVLAATSVHDGRRYALKVVSFDDKTESETLAEAETMAALPRHPNLVRSYAAWVEPAEESWDELVREEFSDEEEDSPRPPGSHDLSDEDSSSDTPLLDRVLVLQMELCALPTLHDVLAKQNALLGSCQPNARVPPYIRWHWVQGLAAALRALHAAGFVHNDVKPLNIMCCPTTGFVKLLDYGCCTLTGAPSIGGGGTALYAAPERKSFSDSESGRTMPTDGASDVFSAGVCAAEVCGNFATAMERAKVVSQLVASSLVMPGMVLSRGTGLLPCSAEGESLVRAMLQHSPVRRPSSAEVEAIARTQAEAALDVAGDCEEMASHP
mmetsp:Transcript_22077/g.47589  ORF Transcript_22077/g.47589 Transcript_22077/m.47589 type:complete len:463 (-) Transcript_22077:208-1596(-)